MQALLDAVRTACLPGLWSQGVKLAREGTVARVSSSPSEITVRVRVPGLTIAPTVTLYPEDAEWSCDCGGKVDPCAHAAAAAIACAQGTAGDTSAAPGAPARSAGAREAARLGYRLTTRERRLYLGRVVIRGSGEAPYEGSLLSDVARRSLPADVSPTREDLEVDRLLGSPPKPAVTPAAVAPVLRTLAGNPNVTLDGRPIQTSGDALSPEAIVEDAPGGGFILRMVRAEQVTDVVAMGVVRAGNTLHPITEAATTGFFLERLPLTRRFSGASETELVTQILPELSKRMTVHVRTKRLPGAAKEARPRIAMDLSHQGHTLSVLPTLVYGDPPIARIDGDAVVSLGGDVPVRRLEAERELLRRLRDELHLVPGRRVDLDGSEAIRFASKLRDFQTRERPGEPGLLEGRPLHARLDLEGGRFDVVFETDASGDGPPRRAETETVLRAFRDGLPLVPLLGGGWAPLPSDWLVRHGDRVMDLLSARDAEKKLGLAALPQLGDLCDALDHPKPPELQRLAPLLEGFTGIPRARLPADLTATLRHYQETGVDWLAFLKSAGLGGILADDMGLGKTLQTICVLSGRGLIVCPKSVVHNWAAELARFRPRLRTVLYHGSGRAIDSTADVTLTTYAVLRLDTEALSAEEWDTVVLDEAQAIKNATSQTARAAFQLRGKLRLALSGTPVENRLEELWSLMHFANPGLLGGRADFQERYTSPITAGSPGAAVRLRAKIRPFVLRRLKRDVAPELPPRTDAVLHVELDETERSLYDAVRVATQKDLTERLSEGAGVLAALEALLRLRQAACHPQLVPGQHAATSSKVERLVEALEEVSADGHKALVFSQWTSLLDLVEPHLREAGIAFTRLDGSTRDRAAVVGTFQSDDGPPVMLVSLKAGGTGLNLTAADHVFLMDPWWNPAVEDQAADRAHRIGQERPVLVYRMVSKDTVEERILALQDKKRAVADVALGDADHGGGLTKEELMSLLD